MKQKIWLPEIGIRVVHPKFKSGVVVSYHRNTVSPNITSFTVLHEDGKNHTYSKFGNLCKKEI
jgi:hypothetical protein